MIDSTASFKENFIEAVKIANKELYDYINNSLCLNDLQYSNKIGFGGDNSLNIDIIAENIFIKHLEKFGNIYSEECGLLSSNKEYTIIIDPLDGSNNFQSDLPYYGTSIALKKDDAIVGGFVSNLISSILTYRIFDDDIKYFSLLNQKEIFPIEVSKTKLGIFERAYIYPKICEKFKNFNIKFRTLGAVALSLCDVKKYDFVLFLGPNREFDIAASLYINKDFYIFTSHNCVLVSKNKQKFDEIKEIIKEI